MLWEPLRLPRRRARPRTARARWCSAASTRPAAAAGPVAWVHGTAMRSEPTMFAGRDQVNPQAGKDCAADVYAQAGITDPRREIDCAEVYVPFSWYEPMWLENLGFCAEGEGWKLTESGATALDGDIPWNPSGGVLSSNPIGASGLIRFAEAAQQVRGRAGDYQVRRDGPAGARPRLRRRLPVLRDVGRRQPTSPEAARSGISSTQSRNSSSTMPSIALRISSGLRASGASRSNALCRLVQNSSSSAHRGGNRRNQRKPRGRAGTPASFR